MYEIRYIYARHVKEVDDDLKIIYILVYELVCLHTTIFTTQISHIE